MTLAPGSTRRQAAYPSREVDRPTLGLDVPVILYADEWGGVGGTAGYVVMLARGLRRRGYSVAAICRANEAIAPMRAALQEAGVDVRAIEGVGGRLDRLREFGSLMREYRGGVLALMMGYFTRGGVATVAGVLAGAGAVVRAELTPPEPPVTRRQKIGLRLKDVLTDRFVVGAIDNREAFSSHVGIAPSKIHVVHTGIELERFQPGRGREKFRARWGFSPETVVVGVHSRLSDVRKGVDHFLEMAAQLAPAFPRVAFLVSGDGVLRPGLEGRAAEFGIRDRLTFAGWQSDPPSVFAAMDVFVMPSLSEGGPTTVLEAMAMGRAVVATRVGMVPEVVEHGRTGLIVPPADSVALAQAVSRLVKDEGLRAHLGVQARSKAARDFSVDLMVERYLGVFADARAAHPPPGRRARAILPSMVASTGRRRPWAVGSVPTPSSLTKPSSIV